MKWTRRVPIIPIISRVHFGNRSQNNPIRNDPMEHGNALLQGIASPNNSTNQQPARLRFRWACFFTILWLLFLAVYGIDRGTLYRTESLRAMIARETLSGHWLVTLPRWILTPKLREGFSRQAFSIPFRASCKI